MGTTNPHENILSKFGCREGMRQKAFQNEISCVSVSQDYAEQLPFKFNLKIQSEHFGKGRNLSIQESSVETHTAQTIQAGVVNDELTDNKEEYPLQIHNHFSNDSRQDAVTTTAHMELVSTRQCGIARMAVQSSTNVLKPFGYSVTLPPSSKALLTGQSVPWDTERAESTV
jgi:hypothetical protein